MKSKPLLVLGLMSGTSADAIDIALAKVSGAPPSLKDVYKRQHYETVSFSLSEHHVARFYSAPPALLRIQTQIIRQNIILL